MGARRGLAGGLAALLLTSGCATLIHGTTQRVTVSSSPTSARVLVDGVPVATTPATVELSRRLDGGVVRVERDGFEAAEVILHRRVSPLLLANLPLLLGVVGGGVDLSTGAAYKLEPDRIYVALVEAVPGAPALPPARRPPPRVATTRGRWSLGGGLSVVQLLMPLPFAEAGLRLGPVTARGQIGYIIAFAEARAEVALGDRLYVFDGTAGVVQGEEPLDVFGIGLDTPFGDDRHFLRAELGFAETSTSNQTILRAAVGLRR